MAARERRTIFSVFVSAIFVVALVAAGFSVRALVSNSFTRAAYVRTTRDLTYNALKYQLDEETGVRGFVGTRAALFLKPYSEALVPFASTLAALKAHVTTGELRSAVPAVLDIEATNSEWRRTVGEALIHDPSRAGVLERRGKVLVDRIRADAGQIDALLNAREETINAEAARAIDRIVFLIGGAIAVILALTIFYVRQQAEQAAQERDAQLLAVAYKAEKRIADTLQEAFVQRALPSHPTFRFSAKYVPATEETKVGGDWYDALELPDNRVLFVIGDVTGHGIDAAVTMNRARQALISSALYDPDPAALLKRVSDELYHDKAALVTAVAGFADADTFQFVYSSAGHPPPLLIEPGGEPTFLAFGSLPLGAMAETEYRTERVQTVPGAVLVLYTDGAVEHTRDAIEGEAILIAAVKETLKSGSTEPATTIHDAVFQGRPVGDDVAILTIGFEAKPASGVTISSDNAKTAFVSHIALAEHPSSNLPPQLRDWGKSAKRVA